MDSTPNLRLQEEYYTDRWNSFTFANKLDLSRVAAILDVLARIGAETPPAICDLGCGAGWATGIFGMFGPTTGVDLSNTVLASQRFPHCAFVSANILEWSAPEAAFDVVISVEVIEHIDRDLQAKYLEVAHRLLKPGGHLILTTPNADTMRAMPSGGKEWSNQPIENWLTPRELFTLLEPGFTVESIESIIAGMGSRGSYRLMNSARIDGLMRSIGAGSAWRQLRLRNMYGLHLVAHALKKARRF